VKISATVQGVKVVISITDAGAPADAVDGVRGALADTLAMLERCTPSAFVEQELVADDATTDGSFGVSFGDGVFVVQQDGFLSKEAHDAHIAACEQMGRAIPLDVQVALHQLHTGKLTKKMRALLIGKGFARDRGRWIQLTDPGSIAYQRVLAWSDGGLTLTFEDGKINGLS
jgi:hypothetical protein